LARIVKTFSFDAAHRLPNHNGKCKNLHGHTYKLEVAVSGPVGYRPGSSDEGMVVDFGQIKETVKPYIDSQLDHQFLNESVALFGMPPTAEVIACNIFRTIQFGISSRVHLEYVRLWETPDSYAEVTVEDVSNLDLEIDERQRAASRIGVILDAFSSK
jgi:6-pyruvoyltetrahydropterin/6-carboxytetrahydropterin synthase